tara:strand:- start:81 stop:1622 length:1542 start_codon:yes stop_codon:yes gene_type:complete
MRLVFLYIGAIIVLLYNTGIVSDDFTFIKLENQFSNIFDNLINGEKYLARPVFRYLFSVFYYFVDINEFILIDYLKILQIISIFYMVTKFFSIFIGQSSAMLISFLFIFFPTHDSTTYWYLEVSLSLSIGLYLYAYYLAENNRIIIACVCSFLASFVSYGSPPIAIALFILCILKNSYIKGLTLYLPNLVYTFYFIYVSKYLNQDVQRIDSDIHISSLIKQYLLQFFTFIDAVLGPSFFLKIYYSILENGIASILLAIIFITIYVSFTKFKEHKKVQIDKNLIITLVFLILLSFGIFSFTGGYPQLAFNLGNRTTIYSSLLISYLIVAFPMPKTVRDVILFILIFSIMGISSHWKQWNRHQINIIENIKNNEALAIYDSKNRIYVTGNKYSKMGPFSHIEFLSENHVIISIFNLVGHRLFDFTNDNLKVLSRRYEYRNETLYDNKYPHLSYATADTIVIYESDNDRLINLPLSALNNYIDNLPEQKRHWIQMIDNKKINSLILKLMPRLKYSF